jgi:hypothetical protein
VLLLLVYVLFRGWRQGVVSQIAAFGGLVLGLVVGMLVAPAIGGLFVDEPGGSRASDTRRALRGDVDRPGHWAFASAYACTVPCIAPPGTRLPRNRTVRVSRSRSPVTTRSASAPAASDPSAPGTPLHETVTDAPFLGGWDPGFG